MCLKGGCGNRGDCGPPGLILGPTGMMRMFASEEQRARGGV